MPEIGTLGLMSGDGKRSAGLWPQATAPILDSTGAEVFGAAAFREAAFAKRISMQEVIRRGLDLWFAQEGLPSCDEAKRRKR